MDFDLSKENIQPLRGGRNASQLSLALQAESSVDMRREIQHQREIYENAIKAYQGDDPLENWYTFITWVEQSYPKNGHEGNLIQLLELCLRQFENDKRYTHDRRFCKLWIKYIDVQQNPLELYQMMHARGLAIGCADLYKAWAYYHEAAGDFKSANEVFEMGKQALAQPLQELEIAQQNLIVAAGNYAIYGRNEQCLLEKRRALTSLHSTKTGKVNSVRDIAAPTAGVYPSTSQARPNAQLVIYEDESGLEGAAAAAPPVSILTAVKRQEAPKENTMKPGPWTTMPLKKKMAVQHTPSFKVHVDEEEGAAAVVGSSTPHQIIDLNREPPKFPTCTKENYENWVVQMKLTEPVDNRMIPMYPKSRVYADPTTEYSLEELAALRYQKMKSVQNRMVPSTSFQHLSGASSVVSPIPDKFPQCRSMLSMETVDAPECSAIPLVPSPQVQRNFLKPPTPIGNFGRGKQVADAGGQVSNSAVNILPFNIWCSPQQSQPQDEVQPKGSAMKTPFKILSDDDLAETGSRGSMDIANAAQPMDSANINPCFDEDSSHSSYEEITSNIQCSELNNSCNTQMFEINLNDMKVSTPQPKQHFGQNCFGQVGSSKKQLFDSDDVDDISRSRREDILYDGEASTIAKNNNGLFTILEESKSYRSSSSSSGATTKSSVFSLVKPTTMTTISEEHNSYLAQNLMANEALRKSLLGDLLTGESSPVTPMQDSPLCSPVHHKKMDEFPSSARGGLTAPSDPFSSAEIERLLKLVAFPGPHVPDFHSIHSIPRFSGKKETLFVGPDQYIIEKVLGKGSYGTVFKALDFKSGSTVALKYQKPANKWEFYICREIQNRLRNNLMRERFMNVTCGYFSDNASVLVYEFMPHGSLLDLANHVKLKSGKPMLECLCFYFCIQMLQIVETMHQIKIIHADIKPDNFLIQLKPKNTIDLQLIDFGCSIDMSLYPPDTVFTKQVTTENFICCEMRENKPWNYHTDLFCVAATAHVLLFDKYIDVQKKYDAWYIKEKLPRYMHSDLWNRFFNALLNQQSEAGHLKGLLDDALSLQFDKFTSAMKSLVNLIKDR